MTVVVPAGYYVYVFRDLEGVPRYVGKGTGNRHAERSVYAHTDAMHLLLKSKKHMPAEIIGSGLTEEQAYALEVETISRFGRQLDGGTLFNVSKGGRQHGAHSSIADAARAISIAEVTRLIGSECLSPSRYERILFRVQHTETKAALQKAADDQGRSVSSLLERIAVSWLQEKNYLPKPKKPRS
jgi:hypothetical protein